MFMKVLLLLFGIMLIGFLGFTGLKTLKIDLSLFNKQPEVLSSPSPSPTPLPSPTPTPSPLTFSQMNELYGPCAYIPTLMYHHIQNIDVATSENHANLTVSPENFRQHLQYLRDRGYNFISMQNLTDFFDSGSGLAAKPILLTFDDGYKDFVSDALPILKEFGAKATLFTPTGLLENPEYMTWNDANDANISGVLVANHTWSHKNVGVANDEVTKEITTADTQLRDHNLNNPKVFSYPYGLETSFAVKLLTDLGYKLAFTTQLGSTLCKQQRFNLPRIRIGNTNISAYGF